MAKRRDEGETQAAPKTAKLKKAGKAAKELMQQPIVTELVAAALTAAAASLANKKTRAAATREVGEATEEVAAIGASVKRALLDAARSLLDSLDEKPPAEKTLARIEPAAPAETTNGGGGKGKGRKKGARV